VSRRRAADATQVAVNTRVRRESSSSRVCRGVTLLERALLGRVPRMDSRRARENDIMICDNYVSVFRCYHDMSIYVLGNADDNELILGQVLDCLHECFDKVFKSQFERRALITQMSQVILIIDEIVDHGVVMHTQSSVILQRIKTVKKAESTGIAAAVQEEQQASSSLFGSVFASARSGLAKQMGF